MNVGDIVVLSEDEVIDAFRDTNDEEYDPEEPYHQEELEDIRERLLADYRFGIILKQVDEYRYSVYWIPGGGILDDYETSFERLK
mgnify:CR=1 FL=1